jgi:hypothetical protein
MTLFNNNSVVAKSSRQYSSGDKVGLLLNLEMFKLDFFINKKHVLSYFNPKWKVSHALP